MVITIEPMINLGGAAVRFLDDGWTVVTADGSLSAQFEHTVLVTRAGCEVLTALPSAMTARRQLHSPINDNYISPSTSLPAAPCS